MSKKGKGQVITVTSGKGGVGKTTTIANLGIGLAMRGYNVVLLDTDIGLRNLDIVMGLENRIVYDIIDVCEGRAKIKQALVRDRRFKNLFLLPASQTRDKDAIKQDDLKNLIYKLKDEYDYILVDCPAGIEQGFHNAVSYADKIVVVTNPEVSAVRDADRVIGILESKLKNDIYLIINRLKPQMIKKGDMLSIDDLVSTLSVNLLGVIPDDENVTVANNKGEPCILIPDSIAGMAYRNVLARLLGEQEEIIDWMKYRNSFINQVINIGRKFFTNNRLLQKYFKVG